MELLTDKEAEQASTDTNLEQRLQLIEQTVLEIRELLLNQRRQKD
jgi:hypothetical protein